VSKKKEKEAEKFPVYDELIVHDGKTITKTKKWWRAVVVTSPKSYPGRKTVSIYQWRYDPKSDKWKRHAKMNIPSKDLWEKIKSAVDEYLEQLGV